MADIIPQKRVLPARERRESAAKRLASSPVPKPKPTVTPTKPSTPSQPSSEPRQKRKYTKRASLVHVSASGQRTSTPTSATDEVLPTKLINSKPLPTSSQKQPEPLSNNEYQSIADSATLSASLHRSRMQWLCDGIFKKYWTKPVKRKGVIEAPPDNPDAKSMHKLGNATIIIEPHHFEASIYTVKDPHSVPSPYYRHPNQHTVKHVPPMQQAPRPSQYHPHTPPAFSQSQAALPSTSTPASPSVKAEVKHEVKQEAPIAQPTSSDRVPQPAPIPRPAHVPSSTPTSTPVPASTRPATPPGGAKTTDPVIQMLAARAATDNHLKELMKVVATSKASPHQLREFQAHIDEFNAIVKRQEFDKERLAETATPSLAPTPTRLPPVSTLPTYGHAPPRPSPLNPSNPPYSEYPAPPPPPFRMEPVIKHVIIEFTSSASAQQAASSDRWLFPEYAVLDMRYGGMEMTCSFFVERKGSEILAGLKESGEGTTLPSGIKWDPDAEYYQPVTMTIKATQHRTIETIARSAKSLTDVQEYMKEVMEKKTRAPREYLVHRLPRDKPESSVPDFVDSAVELSAEEDDELKDSYGI